VKKVFFFLFCFSIGHASPSFTAEEEVLIKKYEEAYNNYHYAYKGPRDEVEVTGVLNNSKSRIIRDATTLGRLAKNSDIIAIGRVTEVGLTNFVIHVESALVGCTNNQSVVISWKFPDNIDKYKPFFIGAFCYFDLDWYDKQDLAWYQVLFARALLPQAM